MRRLVFFTVLAILVSGGCSDSPVPEPKNGSKARTPVNLVVSNFTSAGDSPASRALAKRLSDLLIAKLKDSKAILLIDHGEPSLDKQAPDASATGSRRPADLVISGRLLPQKDEQFVAIQTINPCTGIIHDIKTFKFVSPVNTVNAMVEFLNPSTAAFPGPKKKHLMSVPNSI